MLGDLIFYSRKKIVRILSIGLIISLSFFELRSFANSHIFLKQTGGTGNFSEAIYELNEWLIDNGYFRPRAIDWGFGHNLFFLSQGKIICREIDLSKKWVFKDKHYYNTFLVDFTGCDINKKEIYIAHTENFENLEGVSKGFKNFAKSQGYELIELKRFYQRDREPVYSVYQLK